MMTSDVEVTYRKRFDRHFEELRWLYMELYSNSSMFAELCDTMERFSRARSASLKERDLRKEADPDWYKDSDQIGMSLYVQNFGGNLQGVRNRLDYIEKCNVNVIHLMPFLESPKGRNDGGYAVSDYRKVRPDLGDMDDLQALTESCHKRGISVGMDFVFNHTSDDHEWARRARAGEGEYMSRYYFYNNPEVVRKFEETVPQAFPETAPGNFTYVPECGHYVMTTFYPYQWDLNYHNPRVFNEMVYNFLYLANRGMDMMCLIAHPYIWKEPGTSCCSLPQVHTITRLLRMIVEIVCPSVLLMSDAAFRPEDALPYFGTAEKPECHILYNAATMAAVWNSVATRDAFLLKNQLDMLSSFSAAHVFENYLRNHDDISWNLDYDLLRGQGIMEISHKKYLNDYFRGYSGSSNSRGELCNVDYVNEDARFCGRTASMCGIERAGFEGSDEMMDSSIRMDIMLHALLFMLPGLPVLYSGDEIGQVNDYSYKDDPEKARDARYICRGPMNWKLTENIDSPDTVQGRLFHALDILEKIRKEEKAFGSEAECWTLDTHAKEILGFCRCRNEEKITGLFNFSEHSQTAWINEENPGCRDLVTGEPVQTGSIVMDPYAFRYLKTKKSD